MKILSLFIFQIHIILFFSFIFSSYNPDCNKHVSGPSFETILTKY